MRLFLILLVVLSGCVSPQAAEPAAPPSDGQRLLACLEPCGVVLREADFGLREPIVAVDPMDPARVVALSMGIAFDPAVGLTGTYQLVRHDSTDGGATWTSAPVSPALVGDAPATETYDPALAMLPDGAEVLGGIALAGTNSLAGATQGAPRAFVLREDTAVVVDAGQGAEAYLPLGGAAVGLRAPDKPALMAAPDGALLMAYGVREATTPADEPRARVAMARSTDGGATWKPLETWAQDENAFAGQPVAFDASRWVVPYATFESLSAEEMRCAVATSDDAGSTWSTLEMGPCAFLPALAVADGALYAAMPRSAGGRVDLVLLALVGGAFRDVVTIDEADEKGQNIPALVALDDGALLATYFHALSGDRTSYHAALVRGGNVVASLVLDAEMTRTPRQMGEYFGLAATPRGALATWVRDTEDGGVAVVAARLAITS